MDAHEGGSQLPRVTRNFLIESIVEFVFISLSDTLSLSIVSSGVISANFLVFHRLGR